MGLERHPDNRLLQLADEIRIMKQWLVQFTPRIGSQSMWVDRELYPADCSRRFCEWLDKKFTIGEQVGVLMLMRQARIGHAIFLHLDDPVIAAWWERIREPLAHAMGGRTGERHSGRASSKFPVESET